MKNSVPSRRLLMTSIAALPGLVGMAPQAKACVVEAVSAGPDGVGGAGLGSGAVGPMAARGRGIGVGVLSVGLGLGVASGDELPPFAGAGSVAEPVTPLMADLASVIFR